MKTKNFLRFLQETSFGFTLIELLVTLAIIAIISAVVVPNFTGSQRRAKDDNTVARGSVLDLAKTTLLQEDPNAQANWDLADAKTGYPPDEGVTSPSNWSQKDQAKYELLIPYLSAPPSDLGYGVAQSEYTPMGYWYVLGDINGPTTIKRRIDNANIGPQGGNLVRLTVRPDDPTRGSTSGSGSYVPGTTITIRATAFQGYAFNGWSGASGGAVTTVTITGTPGSQMTVTASFTASSAGGHYLHMISDPNGTTSPAGGSTSGPYAAGYTFGVSASPNSANYIFAGWQGATVNGNQVTFQNDDIYLRPIFVKSGTTYTVNVLSNNSSYGTVSGGGSYQAGTYCTVNASAIPGDGIFDAINGWMEGTSIVSLSPSYTFQVNGNRTLVANFVAGVANSYTLTVTAGTGGTATIAAGINPGASGTTFTITATPSTGYQFVGWSGGDGGSLDNVFSSTAHFTIGPMNTTVKANFIKSLETPPTPPAPVTCTLGINGNLHLIRYYIRNPGYSPLQLYVAGTKDIPYSPYTFSVTRYTEAGGGYVGSISIPHTYTVSIATPIPISQLGIVNSALSILTLYSNTTPLGFQTYGFTYSGSIVNINSNYNFVVPVDPWALSYYNYVSGNSGKCYVPKEATLGYVSYCGSESFYGALASSSMSPHTWYFVIGGDTTILFWGAIW